MQPTPLLVALFASVILCFLPKWLVICFIILFILFSAILLGATASWSFFQPDRTASDQKLIQDLYHELDIYEPPALPDDCYSKRTLVSQNIDPIIKDIIVRILDDHLFAVFKNVTNNVDEEVEPIRAKLVNETWVMVSRIIARLRVVDYVKLLTEYFIKRATKHFTKISASRTNGSAYVIPAHLYNDDLEKDYLRRMADVLLHAFVPRSYLSLDAFRHLLREILAIQVLYRTINTFSDPDFLNRQILMYLTKKPKNAYAESFSQMIQLIQDTYDLDRLREMESAISNEIARAILVYNAKRESIANKGKMDAILNSMNRDDLKTRDLPVYIYELRQSSEKCRMKIASLTNGVNGSNSTPSTSSSSSSNLNNGYIPKKKLYPLSFIMMDPVSREAFYNHLKEKFSKAPKLADQTSYHLIEFWHIVSQMSVAEQAKAISMAQDIMAHPFLLPSIQRLIKIPKEIIDSMNSFISGDANADAFYKTQKVLFRVLQERYYPQFINSNEYLKLLNNPKFPSVKDNFNKQQRGSTASSPVNSVEFSVISGSAVDTTKPPTILDEHLKRAQQILRDLQNRHHNKCAALAANKQRDYESPQLESLTRQLEIEISRIESDIATAEVHRSRTDVWIKNLSSWKAELYSIQLAEDETAALAIIVQPRRTNLDLGCDGWVIARSVNELISLKKKLVKIKPALSTIYIYRLQSIKNVDEQLLEKAKGSINQLFHEIFKDEKCLKSEEVFLFFISSPSKIFRQPLRKKFNKKILPFANLLGINSQENLELPKEPPVEKQEVEKISKLLDESECDESSEENDIAEPGYSLLDAIFDLQGNISWFRKYVITLVQITYKKHLNKQIREIIDWLLSESMVNDYLNGFKNALWPQDADVNGSKSIPNFEQYEGDRLFEMTKARTLENLPVIMVNSLGHATAKQGTIKVLEAIQEKQLNKVFLHEILEVIFDALVPEVLKYSSSQEWEVPR